MTLRRKPKRSPGENPILRRHFVHELHAHAGELAQFLDQLAGYPALLDVTLADLVHDTGADPAPA